mgnify:FL=1
MTHHNDSYMPGAATVVFIAPPTLLLPWLGETMFNSKGEPREAIVAVSMLQGGNWLLPVNFGTDIPFKPPFLAWLIAIFAKLFNGGVVNEYISRLPSALAAIAMVMAGYHWASRVRGPRFAIIFSFVTLTCVEVFRAAVACRLDMVLTACMVIAMYMLYDLGERKGRLRWLRYIGVVLLLSCATMTKGPVGTLLPCLIVGIYRLLRRDRFFAVVGKLVVIAVASLLIPAMWYYAAYLQGGREFYDLMLEENIGRLTGTMSYDSHVNPWYYNFMTLAAGLLPWTVLLVAALFGRRSVHRSPLSPAAIFSICAAVITVAFYCIPASKRSVYLLPAYPFICYGIASLLDARETTARVVRFFAWFVAILAVIVPVAVITVQFVDIKDLRIEPLPWWRYVFVLAPMGAGIAWFVNRHSPVGHIAVTVWSLFLAYAAAVMPAVLNPNSNRPEARHIAEVAKESDIITLGTPRYYTLGFYLDDRIRQVPDVAAAATYPVGTVLLVPHDADTTGLHQYYDYELLTKRGSDYRRPIGMAGKKR